MTNADFQPAVQETGDVMVFKVKSSLGGRIPYLVDLTANQGASECDCKDYRTRRGPNLRAGMPKCTSLTMCKHIVQARHHFLNGVLEAMAKSESE